MCAPIERARTLRAPAACSRWIPVLAAAVVWACLTVRPACAQSSGSTIWSFLGIPTNASDQASSNPAIAAAAQAKAAKHQICKKKKAIQYLAGMGCSPDRPEVAAALLAAMGDPDEPVRYEAVKAVLQTAGACQSAKEQRASRKSMSMSDRCAQCKKKLDKAVCDCMDRLCGKAPPKEHKHKLKDLLKCGEEDCPEEPESCGKGNGNCCTPEIREKLQQLAYGRDDRGCFLEKSSRVRAVAAEALEACSACGGCRQGDCNSRQLREMPPEEERELMPEGMGIPRDGDCVYDSVLVPAPQDTIVVPTPHPETVYPPLPTQAEPVPMPMPPEPPPVPPEPLEIPESLPPPSARHHHDDSRLAMLPGSPGRGGPPVRLPTQRPTATAAPLWKPRDPGVVSQTVPPTGGVFWAQPATPLEIARSTAGTGSLATIFGGFGGLPATSQRARSADPATGSADGQPTKAGPTLWSPRDPAVVLRIVPPTGGAFWAQPATPLETARAAAGTGALAAVFEGFTAPPEGSGSAAVPPTVASRTVSRPAWLTAGFAVLVLLAATAYEHHRRGGSVPTGRPERRTAAARVSGRAGSTTRP